MLTQQSALGLQRPDHSFITVAGYKEMTGRILCSAVAILSYSIPYPLSPIPASPRECVSAGAVRNALQPPLTPSLARAGNVSIHVVRLHLAMSLDALTTQGRG